MYRFLLVSLSIEAILTEPTIHRRKEKLKQMSKGQDAGDVYSATFERIKGQEDSRSRLGMDAIMWIAYSERPLQPDELCQALGVEVGSEDLNNDNAPNIRTIMRCGLGLITVDSSSSTVRLVHFTLQEYILANPTLFQSPHSMIAEVCLAYLNFASIRGLSPTLSSPPPAAPFLEYASCYWGAHARRETSEKVIPLALKLLGRFDRHISCKILLLKEYSWERPFDTYGSPIGFTGLHCGAFLGVLEPIVSSADIKKWDLNAVDAHGSTALAWAVRRGHDRDVKVLLEQVGLCPDTADNEGRTPLWWASQCVHCEIVKMLLERRDVDPSTADSWGRTPLSLAAKGRHEEVAEVLLQRRDVNPNTADKDGSTPLLWAVSYQQEGIVKMLLQRDDVNPNAPDKDGQTPLWLATKSRCQVITEILLENNNVNPDTPDKCGRTPLSWGAQHWEVEIVRSLLKRNDVNPNTADKDGFTPLWWAVSYEGEGVVKMLLQRDDVNPNAPDKDGRTPLSWAAGNGYVRTTEILLERDDVNPDAADERGRTPLLWATGNWGGEIVEILLGRDDVDPDRADEMGRTPLSWACSRGHAGIVEMLLERNDVNPDAADQSGLTPLSWAVINEKEKIVEMLLERSDPNLPTTDDWGRKPSPVVAGSGYEGVVEMPLQSSDINPGAADKSDGTLLWAPESEREGVVGIVSQLSDVDSNPRNMGVQKQSSRATMFGHEEIVDMLLEQNDVSLDPISVTRGGYERAMDISEWNDVNRDTVDEIGGMPFTWSPGCVLEAIPETLFEQRDVNPNPVDPLSQTPFPWATGNWYPRVEQL